MFLLVLHLGQAYKSGTSCRIDCTQSHARSFRFAIPAVDPKATANSLQCCALGRATWAVPFVGQTSNGRVETVKT